MRQIKFRGQLPSGKFVYGDVVQWGGFMVPRICSWENGVIYDIVEESVAQLIGIDAHGREVYEGDKVIRVAGDEDFNPEKTFPMAASIEDYAAIRDEEIILVVKDNGRTDKNTGGRTA